MSRTKIAFLYNLSIILITVKNTICDELNKSVELILEQGVLSGKVEESYFKQKEYYAFRGIPYAEPPIVELRFQPPKPLTTWEGTYEAHKNKPTCLQFCSKERNNEPFGLSGSEDCLYLSVFTPALEGNYPVVVFDYNDKFKTGFNGTDTYSPDFFIEEDVIVVTITHRLGALGYLTTEDDVIPSNNGLKDFILGLKWVQSNIEKFGGDPNRVTIMGNSGGAAIANILLFSQQAKGLFSAVIMQSGTALDTAYFYENPRTKAFELGKALEVETDDSKILLEELQKIDAEKFVLNEITIYDDESLLKNHMNVQIFAPSIEKEHENSIITALPEKGQIVNDVPVLIGLNSREGLDFAQHLLFDPRMFEKIMGGITMYLPIRTGYRFDRDSLIYNSNATKEINEVYYKDGYLHIGNILEYAAYLGDVLLGYAVDKTAKSLVRDLSSPVYYYMFDFRGVLNENSELLARYSRVNIQQWGATTTDELCYLHLCTRKIKSYNELKKLITEQHEFKVLKKVVRMWTNFAKTRNPTPEADDNIIKGVIWEPMNKEEQEAKYLHITKKLKMKKEPLGGRAQFWNEFLEKYSKMAVDGVVTDKEGEGYRPVPLESRRDQPNEQFPNEEDGDDLIDDDASEGKDKIPFISFPEEEITNQQTAYGNNEVIVEDAKVIVVDKSNTTSYEEIHDEL